VELDSPIQMAREARMESNWLRTESQRSGWADPPLEDWVEHSADRWGCDAGEMKFEVVGGERSE